MVARVLKTIEGITATHNIMKAGAASEKAKAAELSSSMLSEQEIETLQETITLLTPVTNFTYWAGQGSHPTISHIYPKVHTMVPEPNTFVTEQAR
ncbi:hypothetical protein BGZ80_004743, partial [Entomortierella chlamydospora]